MDWVIRREVSKSNCRYEKPSTTIMAISHLMHFILKIKINYNIGGDYI